MYESGKWSSGSGKKLSGTRKDMTLRTGHNIHQPKRLTGYSQNMQKQEEKLPNCNLV